MQYKQILKSLKQYMRNLYFCLINNNKQFFKDEQRNLQFSVKSDLQWFSSKQEVLL